MSIFSRKFVPDNSIDENISSTESDLNYIREKLNQVSSSREYSDFFKAHPLGEIWKSNLIYLNEVIFNSKTSSECLSYAFKHHCYSYFAQMHSTSMNKFIEWTLNWLKKQSFSIESWPENLKEAEIFPEEATINLNGRRLSSDFVRWQTYLLEINKFIKISSSSKYLEIGSGYGGMARAFKLANPNAKLTLVDIPQSTCFSYLFLKKSFPDCSVEIASSEADVKNSNADILLVPSPFAKYLEGKEFDLLLNSQSFGEMDNKTVLYWADLIQNKLSVKNTFLHNRILNDVLRNGSGREFENLGSVFFDSEWQIKQWEYDPEFGRCPFIYGLAPRSCMIIASRNKDAKLSDNEKIAKSWDLIKDIIYQDWAFMYYDRNIPQVPICGSNIIDGSMEGNLFRLWESIRLYPNKYNITLMLKYLELIRSGLKNIFFEEEFYYLKLLESKNIASNKSCTIDVQPFDSFLKNYKPPFNFRTQSLNV